MSGAGKSDYSVLQKIQVSCKTCGVSDAFYSNLSVEQFKSRHRGHEIVGGGREENPTRPATNVVKLPPRKEEPMETEPHTRLAKVKVDMVVFPVLPDPVFRVRGFKDDLEEAFITTVRFEHAAKVKEIIAGGEYVDHELGGVRYVWEPEAVECEAGVREKLGLPVEVPSPAEAPPTPPEPRDRPQEEAEDTVARTNELLFGKPSAIEAPEAVQDPGSVPSSLVPTPPPPPPPQPAAELQAESEPVRAEAPRPPDAKAEVKAVPSAPQLVKVRAAEEADEGKLLVSKSWYIQGGAENRNEAIRISKVLKAFRWKVEPIYTIGVILDDMLSVETSRNQISRTLIMRVESAGYRLTAVSTEQGRPVAWFRRTSPDDPTDGAHAEVKPPGAEGSQPETPDAEHPVASDSTGQDDLVAELEPDAMS